MQFHLGQTTYQFQFRPAFFLLSLFFFVILCSLGTWQLYRYQFKKNLLIHYQTRIHSSPQPFLSYLRTEKDWQFQPVTLEGQFDHAHTILIQNQLHEGREGYEVITPMHLPDEKKQVLVDRGWIAKEKLTTLSKAASPRANFTHLNGYIKLINERQFILGKNIYSTEFPLVMQKIDFKEIENISGKTFFPLLVRMTSPEKDGLIRDWAITTLLPAKHLGYSIQWFLMATVLMIAFFCFCCESKT